MTDENQNAPAPEAAAPESTAIPEAKLSLNDLNTMMQIINVCSGRGAIRANEMAAVGALHAKLTQFLVAAGVLNADGSAAKPAASAPAAEAASPGDVAPLEDPAASE